MEEYRTYVFEKSKKKARKRLTYNLSILAAIGGILYMLLIGIMGIEFGIIGSISLIITLLQMKNYDDKYMGITAYGNRKEKFFINEKCFTVGGTEIPFSELKNLVIYVDEYAGKPRDFFGIHHGGNNEISFNHKGKEFSINYIIKNKSDFQKVEQLVSKIENQQTQDLD